MYSAVLLASLERSKKKWLSDGILVRYYTKPKKTKREQIQQNNPPKETMSKLGPCTVVIGPHRFDAMIYTVKDPAGQAPIHYSPRPMVHYNQPNTFQPRYHYPPPNQQGRPPYSPAAARPPQGYPGNQPPHQRGPQQRPPPGQQPPHAQAGQQPPKPSPDPVIQMLATRAAADPELKALMRVVASSQASQEQLRAFQTHIDELNAIIKSREKQEQRQQDPAAAPTQTQSATPTAQNRPVPPPPESQQKKDVAANAASDDQRAKAQSVTPSETPSKEHPATKPKVVPAEPPAQGTPQPGTEPQTPAQTQNSQPASQPVGAPVKREPHAADPTPQAAPSGAPQPAAPTPAATPGPVGTSIPNTGPHPSPSVRPAQTPSNIQQPSPRPGPPIPPARPSSYGNQPPLQSRPQQYGSPTPYYSPNSTGPLPPQMRNFKGVVFEFTSPLTPYGSSTSGHAGSGDRYLFPEHSILEWLPAENTMLASFLVVKKVDPNTPFPIEPPPDTATGRAKMKGAPKAKKPDAKGKGKNSPAPATPTQADEPSSTGTPQNPETIKPNGEAPGTPGTPSEPPTTPANLKEYWQPVTWRIHSTTPRLLEPLTRVVKPADEVRKYMNEVMDRAERAPDGFPALRLPREEAREAFESEGTPASTANAAAANASRSRSSRVKLAEEESEAENNVGGLEEDDELLDFYGSPSGLPPLKI